MGAAAAVPAIIKRVRQLLRSDFGQFQLLAAETLAKIMADGVRFFKGSDGRWEPHHIDEFSR
jgi:hypothetical protein